MTAILFEPHLDDAPLFASFQLLKHRPAVITVLGLAVVQESDGITAAMRVLEARAAMRVLGIDNYTTWAFSDATPDWDAIGAAMRALDHAGLEHVFAPMVEPEDGHEHHDQVGRLALDVFGPTRVTEYATYRRGGGRTHTETEVEWEPGWRALKLKAMACYTSQIELPATRPWFAQDDMLREWVAP